MYSFFRRIRHIGRIRAWYAAEADRRNWVDERYLSPPKMRRPHDTVFEGSWADIKPSYIRVNRSSYVRDSVIETQSKVTRLRRRRKARIYRAYKKRTGE